jgi:hypothetical protein
MAFDVQYSKHERHESKSVSKNYFEFLNPKELFRGQSLYTSLYFPQI